MKNNQGGELVEKLGIEDFNEKLPGVSLRSIREDVQQESNGILTNLNTSDNTIVKGYLNARVFSVTGNPGSFTYERIKSYGVSNYGRVVFLVGQQWQPHSCDTCKRLHWLYFCDRSNPV